MSNPGIDYDLPNHLTTVNMLDWRAKSMRGESARTKRSDGISSSNATDIALSDLAISKLADLLLSVSIVSADISTH